MSANFLSIPINLGIENVKSGKFDGIAYSGGVIAQHGWIQNLIIDLSTLKFAKTKTPILRDHNTSLVIGHGLGVIGGDVRIQGELSKRTSAAQEIIALSEDGVDFEMSLGVYGGQLLEFKDEVINGINLPFGTKLVNGVVREVSFTILGADGATKAEVFSVKKIEENLSMNLNAQNAAWVKLACGCGGHKDSTPEEIEAKFADQAKELSAKEDEIKKKKDEVDEMKKKYEAAQAELEKLKGDAETKVRADKITAKAKEKNVELKAEAIEKASKSEESTEVMLSALDSIPASTPKNMRGATDLGESGKTEDHSKDVDQKDPESIRLAAEKLVKDGVAKTFLQALDLVTEKKETK